MTTTAEPRHPHVITVGLGGCPTCRALADRDALRSRMEQLQRDAVKHNREMQSIHNDMLALTWLLGLRYDGRHSPAGWLHAKIMPRVEQLEQVVEAARIIDEQIWVPGAASDPDAYHDATMQLRSALAALDQEERKGR